eukprot:CAMPEP_0113465450 /NCGR_PEP_ID=MMETSP0014_2-20120614/13747_1 /TAXON_ID=2857 /ORGANISM="Nitzschia sp." /LENGTH=386 /DNA_ID=CAMNT_0000357611 /DNA_START=22 /DNA_END=1182 /DNA_ORIENTATION=+ /assembly_acc=CAM_ASM_000159
MARYKQRQNNNNNNNEEEEQGRRDRHRRPDGDCGGREGGGGEGTHGINRHPPPAAAAAGGGGSSNRPCLDTGPGMSPIEAARRIRELEAENRTLLASSTCQTEDDRLRATCAAQESIIQERDDMIDGQTVIIKQLKKENKRLKKMEDEDDGANSDDDDDDDDSAMDYHVRSNNNQKKKYMEIYNAKKRRKTSIDDVYGGGGGEDDGEDDGDDDDDGDDSGFQEGDGVGPVRKTKSHKNRRASSTSSENSETAATATATNLNDIIPQGDKLVPATGEILKGQDLKQALMYLGMNHYKLHSDAAHRFAYGPYLANSCDHGIGLARFYTVRRANRGWPKFEKRFLSVTYESLSEQKKELAKHLYESDHINFASPVLSKWIEEHGGVVDA